MRILPLAIALAAASAAAAGCGPAPTPDAGMADAGMVEIAGEAFGTTWHVRVPRDAGGPAPERLAPSLRAELEAVDRALSTWRDDSELARFNAGRGDGWMAVSPATAAVAAEALAVHRRSRGAFDPTVGPLLALWGFGPDAARRRGTAAPSPAALRRARGRTGADALEVRLDPPALRKRRPELTLELSGIAEGHAVDALAGRLAAQGVPRFLVEIGGELRARGAGPSGGAWQVGIERPTAGRPEVGWIVRLDDAALATSGTQRNRRRVDDRARPHVLDPRRGRPVAHALRSVSVRAPRAATADAWATALLVLGPEEGWRVAQREGLAALFVAERDGALVARATPALAPWQVAVADGDGGPVEARLAGAGR